MTNDNEGKRRVDDMEGMREGDEEGGTTTPGSSRLVYRVDDSPPAHIALISAIQVILYYIGSIIAVAFVVYSNVCPQGDSLLLTELLSSTFVITGVATITQATIGVRLPIVQGCAFAYLPPIIALMTSEQWRCPQISTNQTFGASTDYNLSSHREMAAMFWKPRLAELSGGVVLASIVQVVVGFTGIVGMMLKFVGPLTIIPTVSLIAIGLYPAAANMCQHSWIVTAVVFAITILCSLVLWNVQVPLPVWKMKRGAGFGTEKFRLFQLFASLLAIGVGWLLCYILTITDVFRNDPTHRNYQARTDVKIGDISKASWFQIPYPGQFGWPTFGAGAFVGMLAAALSITVESIGSFYATARICEVAEPPQHALNRSIAVEGLVATLSGLMGVGCATTSFVAGHISLTGMAARSVIVYFGVILIGCGLCGKLAAVLGTIPQPVIGTSLLVTLTIIFSAAMSLIQTVDMQSSRNMIVLGLSMICGMMLPHYVRGNPGIVSTGSDSVDQLLTVMLSTPMLVGCLLGFSMDNLLPGSRKSRGFRDSGEVAADDVGRDDSVDSQKTFDLPYVSGWLRRQTGFLAHVPFLPGYKAGPVCRCRRTKSNKVASESVIFSTNL